MISVVFIKLHLTFPLCVCVSALAVPYLSSVDVSWCKVVGGRLALLLDALQPSVVLELRLSSCALTTDDLHHLGNTHTHLCTSSTSEPHNQWRCGLAHMQRRCAGAGALPRCGSWTCPTMARWARKAGPRSLLLEVWHCWRTWT